MTFERIINAAKNSPPSAEQLAEWAKRDAENEKIQSYDWIHRESQSQRTALTGWTGRTVNIDDIQFSPAYAIKQGYDDPKAGILFADWNDVSKRVYSILERVKDGHKRILFQISDVGQFDIGFAVWEKIPEEDESNKRTSKVS